MLASIVLTVFLSTTTPAGAAKATAQAVAWMHVNVHVRVAPMRAAWHRRVGGVAIGARPPLHGYGTYSW